MMFHVEHHVDPAKDVSRETSGRDEFIADYQPSPATLQHFDQYAAILADWQQRLNLVGPSTLPHVWTRHFADSAQLLALAQPAGAWLDIGSGAGFPGLVVALLGAGPVHLVESIEKKCAFLRAAVGALDLGNRVTVHRARLEALPAFPVATISARACAPLSTLFDWGLPFATPSTRWLLPKGVSANAEMITGTRDFHFDSRIVASRTDPVAGIVVARNVRRR